MPATKSVSEMTTEELKARDKAINDEIDQRQRDTLEMTGVDDGHLTCQYLFRELDRIRAELELRKIDKQADDANLLLASRGYFTYEA